MDSKQIAEAMRLKLPVRYNGITYQQITEYIPKVKKRSRLILETLGDRQMTASEITEELVAAGKIPYFNRNYVAPRLTELKDIGVLETVGRRKATRSDATEAVWARKELPHEPR